MTVSHYPVHVEAHIDPGLSRWQWLFKWLLAIPHFVVLAFLWAAFVVLSVVAFFAILFTGHYPRSIFDFNVGVMRWTWRVSRWPITEIVSSVAASCSSGASAARPGSGDSAASKARARGVRVAAFMASRGRRAVAAMGRHYSEAI